MPHVVTRTMESCKKTAYTDTAAELGCFSRFEVCQEQSWGACDTTSGVAVGLKTMRLTAPAGVCLCRLVAALQVQTQRGPLHAQQPCSSNSNTQQLVAPPLLLMQQQLWDRASSSQQR